MDHLDLAWLDGRAKEEFQAAQRAGSIQAARPHYSMAVRYLERAEALKRRLRSGTDLGGSSSGEPERAVGT